ncbi:MAG: outer membrane lipoprotein chaperone LolA [Steroidobacteraceae bacterium]
MGRARPRLSIALAAVLTAAAGAVAQAAGTGTAPLARFLGGLHSFKASFSQTVTGAHGRVVSQATGEVIVLRPGRFRWEVHSAGESGDGQLLVADGRNLWYYDSGLQQVTVRPEASALTATPAMLLSGGAGALSAFDVTGAGTSKGLDWVRVVPKAADADFKEALLGFSGRALERMVLEDKLGQTATLGFTHAKRNVPVATSEVSFTAPHGADVIGTPVK